MIGDIKDGIELIKKVLDYKKNKKEERFEKMLNLVKKIVRDICRKAEFDKDVTFTEDKIIQLIKGDNLNKKEKIIRKIILIELPEKINIFVYFMKLKEAMKDELDVLLDHEHGKYTSRYPFILITKSNECFFQFSNRKFYFPKDNRLDDTMICNDDYMYNVYDFDEAIFSSGNIDEIKFAKQDLEKLKQELPKILTPDVFDGEKLIVKDE